MADKSVITQEKLQEYHENFVYPYLNGSTHTGFTPVGTVISYFGETAPTHFLICDGTAYNKADYPQLWTHLSSLTDTTPYVVDGDNTKFKVPDLRGEFLRGTGTNSHTDQGNGAGVGEHQDATAISRIIQSGLIFFGPDTDSESIQWGDGFVSTQLSNRKQVQLSAGSVSTGSSTLYGQNVRPTNTSVLFCIAVKDIYIDYALDGFPCEITNPQDKQGLIFDATSQKWVNGAGGLHEYSTTEKVVGTWVDGKPVYEKCIPVTLPSTAPTSSWNEQTIMDSSDIDNIITFNGFILKTDGTTKLISDISYVWTNPSTQGVAETFNVYLYESSVSGNRLIFRCFYGNTFWNNATGYCIIQYTKRSDTPSS